MPSQLLRSEEEEKDILELIMLSSQWWPQSETKFTVHTFIQDWVVQVVCMCASVCVCVHALELWLGKKLTWVNQLGAVWQSQNNRNLFHNFWILWRRDINFCIPPLDGDDCKACLSQSVSCFSSFRTTLDHDDNNEDDDDDGGRTGWSRKKQQLLEWTWWCDDVSKQAETEQQNQLLRWTW